MKKTLSNEKGFVLITSLLMLVVLMIIGIAATNTTTMELQISGNDKLAKQLFYEAESAAVECAQRLENEDNSDNLKPSRSSAGWLFESEKKNDFLGGDAEWDANATALASDLDSQMSMAAISLGRVKGKKSSSIKMTSSAVYGFTILGRAAQSNGQKIIEIGYRKRY